MAQSSWPFENADTSETQYSYLFREFRDPGVVGAPGDSSLKVSVTTALGLSIAAGRAFARGYMLSVTGTETRTLTTAHATLSRIDRVVARFDPVANAATVEVIMGTPGATAPPALTQTDTGVFEIPLARVKVAAGQTTLSASDVEDERVYLGGSVGGWTTSTRPGTVSNPTPPVKGRSLGLNFTTGAWEFWDGTAWKDVVSAVTWANLAGKPTTSTLDGRMITVSDRAPVASDGANGDIWLEY